MRIAILFVGLLLTLKAFACPITITNDTGQKIIIIDPRGAEAIFLDQNETGVIDPTIIHALMKYLQNEKLDFYYPNHTTHPNSYYKKYRLTEKYCVDDPKESELTVSQITNFIQNPSDRFKVEEFYPLQKIHDHGHH
ncbi:hypothetical protein [Simkania negevensis]|uniref:Uncharacterized protein n=1 Tax=Simkania negevensis (strain ATCC VR-1471 / DSM 27360 / Z) TaxID=331113 RepID=F8L2W1_SIMNZ|nr:hypothetical protein [Simkania negevensis]CCB87807.1 unknown protein [Simkania negevensis Z]